MEIKRMVGELNPYTQKKIDRAERERPPAATSRAGSSGSSGSDRVSVSEEAKLRAAALAEANGAVDVRAEKVEELKARIQAGTYVPDNQKTARNLIRDDLDLLL